MKSKQQLPKTTSIHELADFWDAHDLTDFQDQLEVVTERVFAPERAALASSTALIGRAKELEVAGMLIRNGIYVFWPLVDTGADLLATNRDASFCIPVQVKYRAKESALGLSESDKRRFEKPNTVLAFLTGHGDTHHAWFLPYKEWASRLVDPHRRDNRVYVRISENAEWLKRFEGDDGIRLAFNKLLSSTKGS